MPTERLYYDNPTIQAFDATVTRVERRGDTGAVWLDRTAFYPTSGGQPHDLGTLADLPIVDVLDEDDGDLVHLVRGDALPAVGARVHGVVDWPRRVDHMQQHTGQHLLSAVIEHAFAARTVSFHLGSESSTIDLDRELTPSQIAQSETLANRVVWDDVPVSIAYATEEEARALPLRKESSRTGPLRLVAIEGLDLSACGGTHVRATGAIGQLAVASWERFKGGQRLEFLCGGRALARFQQLRDSSTACIRLLSVLPTALPGAIERLQTELKEQKRALAAAQIELAGYEAAALVDAAESFPCGRAGVRTVDGDAVRLKTLASAVTSRSDVSAVFVSAGQPVLAVAARGAGATVACHDLMSAIARSFGGRGGGKPDLAQCGGLQASPSAVLQAAREWLLGR